MSSRRRSARRRDEPRRHSRRGGRPRGRLRSSGRGGRRRSALGRARGPRGGLVPRGGGGGGGRGGGGFSRAGRMGSSVLMAATMNGRAGAGKPWRGSRLLVAALLGGFLLQLGHELLERGELGTRHVGEVDRLLEMDRRGLV